MEVILPPDDPRIAYSDFVRLEQADEPLSPTGKAARFDRILDMPGKGYRWDNPGTRIGFRTDATAIDVLLHSSTRHAATAARNTTLRYRIDGRSEAGWTSTPREPGDTVLRLTSPAPGTFHDYEVILPYADAVECHGLRLAPSNDDSEPRLETPPARPAFRYVAYGDSVTHGFTASEASRGYAFRLAEMKGWQLLNMGFGGRSSNPSDAEALGSLAPDLLTVLMGVNDWQSGIPVATYRIQMDAFFFLLRKHLPTTSIYLLTPLWVAPSWKPEHAAVPLEAYRQALRDLVSTRRDPHLHLVEGPSLIDPDPALFDPVAVHPNDQGFAQMATWLADII
ncbi:Lysophospholipase L1 [Verrucomicrobium sp. GAS474]|uniref:SGNH/GDSL hydrolase family protein n=1 Tax=Verrucomicrobium sp. GAS474 TaxID=1882831 RepID=UPI00087DE703|nr:SGNH/GDSL hydrolase family protein [Verrucomicrobium sp. GAS474]SDT99014.1 Lysophospholipase L1 [Verrucomicrobium sp. GAS474]